MDIHSDVEMDIDSDVEMNPKQSTPKKKRAIRNELTKAEKKEFKQNYSVKNGFKWRNISLG